MRQVEQGFTLVEVLVALVMATFLLVIILDGASRARRQSQYATAHLAAVRLGEAILARSGGDPSVRPGHGSEAGFDWATSRHALATDRRGLYALVVTQVDVSKDGRRLESFTTRRLERIATP